MLKNVQLCLLLILCAALCARATIFHKAPDHSRPLNDDVSYYERYQFPVALIKTNCRHLCSRSQACLGYGWKGSDCDIYYRISSSIELYGNYSFYEKERNVGAEPRRALDEQVLIIERDRWDGKNVKRLMLELLIYVFVVSGCIAIGYGSSTVYLNYIKAFSSDMPHDTNIYQGVYNF